MAHSQQKTKRWSKSDLHVKRSWLPSEDRWVRLTVGRADLMAKRSDTRVTIRLVSTESHSVYWTTKSKRTTPHRLELKKYDKCLKRHVLFREAR